MYTVSVSEARTHFHRLLERVRKGEKIVIEKRGKPVGVLEPVETAKAAPVAETIAAIKEFRAGNRLEGLSVRDMLDEGRK